MGENVIAADINILLLEIFLETVPDALVIVDEQGNIKIVNQHLENLSGYSKEELLGRSIEVLVPPKDKEKHRLARQKYSQNPTPRSIQAIGIITLLASGGTEIPVGISLSPLKLGEELLTVAAVRDMTEWN